MYFGNKMHIGVDSKTKMIHSVVTTAANVHDSRILENHAAWRGDPRLGRLALCLGRTNYR